MVEKMTTPPDLLSVVEKMAEALEDIIKEVRDMAPVFDKYDMKDTALSCLFEAEAAEFPLTLYNNWKKGK